MIEQGSWRWKPREERDRRDAHIRELYAMGYTRHELAERFDLTPQRISQIITPDRGR